MELSQVKTIGSGTDRFGRKVYLSFHTAGKEVAGSGTRETKEKYSVFTMIDGQVHGCSFANQQSAMDELMRRISPSNVDFVP